MIRGKKVHRQGYLSDDTYGRISISKVKECLGADVCLNKVMGPWRSVVVAVAVAITRKKERKRARRAGGFVACGMPIGR